MNLSAIILAGGESQRMGRDKAWLEHEGRPLVQLARDKLREIGVTEIFISGRPDTDYSALRCSVLLDLEPGLGPLGGIERGLCRCTSTLLLVLAVDMPGMTTHCLDQLVAQCDRLVGAVPQWQGRLEPLAAVYPKRCHCFAFNRILGASRAARDFALDCLRERAVKRWKMPSSAASCFTNWNAPRDIRRTNKVDPGQSPRARKV